jgi:hypothetical protein
MVCLQKLAPAFWHGELTEGEEFTWKHLVASGCCMRTESKVLHLEARIMEMKHATTSACASRTMFFCPNGTNLRTLLEEGVTNDFPDLLDSHHGSSLDAKLESMARKNIFFLRDAFHYMVRKLENLNTTPLCWDSDLILTEQQLGLIGKMSETYQAAISDLDQIINTPAMEETQDEINRIKSEVETSGNSKSFPNLTMFLQSLCQYWEDQADLVLNKTWFNVRNQLIQVESKTLRQIMCQPLLSFSLFDVFSFPQTSVDLSINDNSIITRVERLSPDSSTILFPNARTIIKRDGIVSFSKVFLRSTDLMHFAGFLHRSYREFDILWGRLDGAEAMCKVLSNTVKEEIYREERDSKHMVKELNNLQGLRNLSFHQIPKTTTTATGTEGGLAENSRGQAQPAHQIKCCKIMKKKQPLDTLHADPTKLKMHSCLAIKAVLNDMDLPSLSSEEADISGVAHDVEAGPAPGPAQGSKHQSNDGFFQDVENKAFVQRLKQEVENQLAQVRESGGEY